MGNPTFKVIVAGGRSLVEGEARISPKHDIRQRTATLESILEGV